VWPSHRCNTFLLANENGTLCGQGSPDKWHCLWTCPSLATEEDEAIINTQQFIPELCDSKEHYYDILLIGQDLLVLDEVFDALEEFPVFTTMPDPQGMPETWPSGYYFGDGWVYTMCTLTEHLVLKLGNLYVDLYRHGLEQSYLLS